MDHVAQACGLDPYEVRRKNAYHVNDETIIGQQLPYCKVDETLDEVASLSNLDKRKQEVRAFCRCADGLWSSVHALEQLEFFYAIVSVVVYTSWKGKLERAVKEQHNVLESAGNFLANLL